MSYSRNIARSAVAVATTLSLSLAFVAAPAAIGIDGFDDAAYAKGKGNDNGRGGGRDKADRDRGDREKGGRDKGGRDKGAKSAKSDKGKSGERSAKSTGNLFKDIGNAFKPKKERKVVSVQRSAPKKSSPAAIKPKPKDIATASMTDDVMVTRDMLGKLGARPAQAAIDAQLRNFARKGYWGPSTVGALAGYQLALRAESGEVFEGYEADALDVLLEKFDLETIDGLENEDLAEFLNTEFVMEGEDATYSYNAEGMLECAGADCPVDENGDPDLTEAMAAAELYEDTEVADQNAETFEELLDLVEDDLLTNTANKGPYDEETGEAVLDTVAGSWNLVRPEDEEADAGDPVDDTTSDS